MKEKFIRVKDKFSAILIILWCKEFVLFTCQYFEKSDYSTCTFSVGLEDKKKSKIFRETIAKFIKQF